MIDTEERRDKALVVRLTPTERQFVEQVAQAKTRGNLSRAVRALLAEAQSGRSQIAAGSARPAA
jgi:hypothetical protein